MSTPLFIRHGAALACASLAGSLLLAQAAEAYPQYMARGEFNCMDCHYSPTGGGLVNQWGRQSRPVALGPNDFMGADPDDWWGHDDASISPGDSSEWSFDVGGDARLLQVFGTTPATIPMLLEVGGVVSHGSFQAYGSVAARQGTPGQPVLAHSREHWLLYALSDDWFARAGRFVVPFGLRTPDHTQYVREDFGLAQWGQTYGLELDWVRDDATFSAAAFLGDLIHDAAELQQRGAVARGTYVFDNKLEVGLSGLWSTNDAREGWAGSAHARWHIARRLYAMGEVAAQAQDSKRTDANFQSTAFFVRAGYFVRPELDLHAEFGHRQVADASLLARSRYTAGANWQLYHYLELIPQFGVETTEEIDTVYSGLLQLHLLY